MTDLSDVEVAAQKQADAEARAGHAERALAARAALEPDMVTVRYLKDHKQFNRKAGDTERVGIGVAKTLRDMGFAEIVPQPTPVRAEPETKAMDAPPADKSMARHGAGRPKVLNK